MDFELAQPLWDILGVLCVYSLWITLICACWSSQILPFTKNLFSYGKLCQPSYASAKTIIPTRFLTNDRMYTSHAAGFAWYYKVASFLAFYAVCELILACFAATGVQPLAYYFPVVYHSSTHFPTHPLSYALFPIHNMFFWCISDYVSSHEATQTFPSSPTSRIHSSSALPISIPNSSIYSFAHSIHHSRGLCGVLDIAASADMQVDLSSQPSSFSPPSSSSAPSSSTSPSSSSNTTASSPSHSSSVTSSSFFSLLISIGSRYFSSFFCILSNFSPFSTTSLLEYEDHVQNTLSFTSDITMELFSLICAYFCVFLVCIHCFRRLYETVYVHVSSSQSSCTNLRRTPQLSGATTSASPSPTTHQSNRAGSDMSMGSDACLGLREDVRDGVRGAMRGNNTIPAEQHILETVSQKAMKAVTAEQTSKTTSKQHILVTICGLVYYILVVLTPMFVSVLLLSRLAGKMRSFPTENPGNYGEIGKVGVLSVFLQHPGATFVFIISHTPVWRLLTLFFGITLFFFGTWHQYKAHRHLADLRRKPPSSTNRYTTEDLQGQSHVPTGSTSASGKYKIPVEGWFAYVSCPHYLAEIIIYIGFALVLPGIPLSVDTNMRIEGAFSHLWTSVVEFTGVEGISSYISTIMITVLQYFCIFVHFCNPMWLCVVWVTSNLYITAQSTHQWYLRTFPEYPRGRNALFPSLRHFFK